jgi:hypothetical protein
MPASGPGPLGVTTQGSWSDGNRAGVRRRGRSGAFLFGFIMFAGTVALGGTFAFVRMRPPLLALTGRSVLAFTTHMGELRRELSRIKAEERTEEKAEEARAAAAAKRVVLQPSELPPVKKVSGSLGSTAAKPAVKRTPVDPHSGNDPHGGVDSAGF